MNTRREFMSLSLAAPFLQQTSSPCAVENASMKLRHARWLIQSTLSEFADLPLARENLTRVCEALAEIGGADRETDEALFRTMAPCPASLLKTLKR